MSWSLLTPMLDRFWVDFGAQNRSKTDQKSVPKGVQHHVRFWTPSRTSKNRFLSQHGPNMARSCPPRRAQVGAKMGSKSVPKRSWKRSRFRSRFWTDFGPILDRCLIDFGTIFGWFWGWIWLIFGLVLFVFFHCQPRIFIFIFMSSQIIDMIYNVNALPVPCSYRFILGPCWGHVDQKIDFFGFWHASKHSNDFEHLWRPFWGRFWNDFGTPKHPKSGPESIATANKPKKRKSSNSSAGAMFLRISRIERRWKIDNKSSSKSS